MTDRADLVAVIAQLRHAYVHLFTGSVKDQRQFADGLIAPQIRRLEKIVLTPDGGEPHPEPHVLGQSPQVPK